MTLAVVVVVVMMVMVANRAMNHVICSDAANRNMNGPTNRQVRISFVCLRSW